MSENTGGILENIFNDIKNYVELKKEYAKLTIIEKTSLIATFILIFFISIWAFFLASVYLSIALVFVLEKAFDNIIPALFIVSGLNLLIIILAVVFKKLLFINPLVRLISKLFK
jgi:hypothetical protein